MRAETEQRLNGIWYAGEPLPFWLGALEPLYRAGNRLDRWWKRRKPPADLEHARIVVVGNITAGGSGKTPLVIRLCRLLKSAGLKPGGWVLINAHSEPPEPGPFEGFKPAWVDATRIAVANGLGTATHPIINTAMIGAFARLLDMPPLSAIEDAIMDEIATRPEANVAAAREAYEAVHVAGQGDG